MKVPFPPARDQSEPVPARWRFLIALALAGCSGTSMTQDAQSEQRVDAAGEVAADTTQSGADDGSETDATTMLDAQGDDSSTGSDARDATGDTAIADASDASSCGDPGPEPNESEIIAASLGTLSDCDSAEMTVSGVVSGAADTDFFRFMGTDRFGCTVNPTARINVTTARVCMFVSCTGGPTTISGCNSGTRATSPAGLGGCCSTGGSVAPDIDCPGSSDDTNIYIRIDQPTGDRCVPYRVTYHY